MPARARILLLGWLLAASLGVAGCGAAAPSHRSAAQLSASHHREHPAAARASGRKRATGGRPGLRPRHRAVPDPGNLPQTPALPSANTSEFHQQMAALWAGVVSGRVQPALPAFFPEGAYVQVKAISDPQSDWHTRLVGGFALDLAAAHALLGSDPSAAHLIEVVVPAPYAHWVSPNVCENRTGYWEVPNSRVVYRLDGSERSFGIASMISWRGVWYVVHLGAVIPAGSGGEVDDPSLGAGVPLASSTC